MKSASIKKIRYEVIPINIVTLICVIQHVRGKLRNDGRGIALYSAIQVPVVEWVISFKIVKKNKKKTLI